MGNADAHSRRGNKSDFYITPPPCVQALVDQLPFIKNLSVLDPCAGTGTIGRVLAKNGFTNYKEIELTRGENFFDYTEHHDVIIGNPPYSLKNEFINHAFTLASHILFILPYNVGNYNHFHKNYLDIEQFIGKWLMTPKFFMTEEETNNPKRGGISAYAWYYWQPKCVNKPAVGSFERYIDLNKYFGE